MEANYLRMIRRMKSKGKREWSVYVLRCGDGSLYTGIAKDVSARLLKHNKGCGAAYTRTHLPVALVYHESKFTRSAALIREAQLKRLKRSKKEALLVSSTSPVRRMGEGRDEGRPLEAPSPQPSPSRRTAGDQERETAV